MEPKKAPHFVIIGDLSDMENYHVGDEAMFEANLIQLRGLMPGVTFTAISKSPLWTAENYGISATTGFNFPTRFDAIAERENLLVEILSSAQQYQDEKITNSKNYHPLFKVIINSDGLIISGGGNLRSAWPDNVYERSAFMLLANQFNKPIIILGQSIGPDLNLNEEALLSRVLPLANLLGLREKASLDLAIRLGVQPGKALYQLDDAFCLDPQAIPERDLKKYEFLKNHWIAISLLYTPEYDVNPGLVASLAEQLEEISSQTNCDLVFIPHLDRPAGSQQVTDISFAKQVAVHFKPETRCYFLEIRPARELLWFTGQADMVISSRYHPLVFGLAGKVPCIGIYNDEYNRIKISGVLAHFGLKEWCLPMELAAAGLLLKAGMELWNKRKNIEHFLTLLQPNTEVILRKHWYRIGLALNFTMDGPHATHFDPVLLDPCDAPAQCGKPVKPEGSWLQVVKSFEERWLPILGKQEDLLKYCKSLETHFKQKEQELAALAIWAVEKTRVTDEAIISLSHHLQQKEEELAALQRTLTGS